MKIIKLNLSKSTETLVSISVEGINLIEQRNKIRENVTLLCHKDTNIIVVFNNSTGNCVDCFRSDSMRKEYELNIISNPIDTQKTIELKVNSLREVELVK